jgi:hypothetical protein
LIDRFAPAFYKMKNKSDQVEREAKQREKILTSKALMTSE